MVETVSEISNTSSNGSLGISEASGNFGDTLDTNKNLTSHPSIIDTLPKDTSNLSTNTHLAQSSFGAVLNDAQYITNQNNIILAQNVTPTSTPRVRSAKQAVAAEVNRLRQQGHTIISRNDRLGQPKISYYHKPKEFWHFGRDADIVSIKDGKYYFTEVKYRGSDKGLRDIAGKISRKIPHIGIGKRLAELKTKVGTSRQLVVDRYAQTIIAEGRGIPGGSIELKPGEYEIQWSLYSKNKRYHANIKIDQQLKGFVDRVLKDTQ